LTATLFEESGVEIDRNPIERRGGGIPSTSQ
jgi:hypothetical protein